MRAKRASRVDLTSRTPRIWSVLHTCSMKTSVIPQDSLSPWLSCWELWHLRSVALWGAEGFGESVTQSHGRNMAKLPGACVKPSEIPCRLCCVSQSSAAETLKSKTLGSADPALTSVQRRLSNLCLKPRFFSKVTSSLMSRQQPIIRPVEFKLF